MFNLKRIIFKVYLRFLFLAHFLRVFVTTATYWWGNGYHCNCKYIKSKINQQIGNVTIFSQLADREISFFSFSCKFIAASLTYLHTGNWRIRKWTFNMYTAKCKHGNMKCLSIGRSIFALHILSRCRKHD